MQYTCWRVIIVAVACGIAGMVSMFTLSHNGISLAPAPAYACGIGQTATMMANDDAALAYPGAFSTTPIGVFARDYLVGQPITFTEDLSHFPTPLDPSLYTWRWDFGDGESATGFVVHHPYRLPGGYTVQVTVMNHGDPGAVFDSARISLLAQSFDRVPVAVATASAQYVQLGGSVTYDAAGSHALVGSDLTYTWNFGDTTTAAGAQVTHRFQSVGQGFVALIVQDQRGAHSYATVPVTIVPQLPLVHVNVSASHTHPDTRITFDATQSIAPTDRPDNRLVLFRWDFGDGTTQQTIQPMNTHLYTKPGVYTVTVHAFDRRNYPGSQQVVIMVTSTGIGGLQVAMSGLFVLGLGACAWAYWRRRRRTLVLVHEGTEAQP
jgi:PKD repeat protein